MDVWLDPQKTMDVISYPYPNHGLTNTKVKPYY